MFSAKKILLSFFTQVIIMNVSGQSNKPTATEIIQIAINKADGDKRLDSITSVEMISQIITSKNDTLSFATKKKNRNMYFVSTLSLGYENSTTIFNNGRAAIIKNQSVTSFIDPVQLETFLLQSFISIDHGYKKLGYELERKEDQRFENFDCYVVLVSSPLGNQTLNYYDKKNGNLLMIIYPNGNKSVFIDFYEAKGIVCPSKILMVDTLDQVSSSTLSKIDYDENIDTNWFSIPASANYITPQKFKTGFFKYINTNEGSKVVREKDMHVEITGESKKEYKIEWSTGNDYLIYRLRNASAPPTNDNIEYIKTRIISWAGNKYYCQYITSANIGGTCAFEKLE